MSIEKVNIITEQIIKSAFIVSNALGCGFLEKVYENALCVELKKGKLKIEQQKPVNVFYNGILVGEYFTDLLVEDTVVVELKTVSSIEKIHEAQLLNYLKAANKRIGILFNFAKPKLEIKRMVTNFTK
ncbi:MAG: GxxExxY protein [Candidatus Omnitrophica bacterium]|nr:GxxExxY protein [Candidatus Omnitrophota bacterium]